MTAGRSFGNFCTKGPSRCQTDSLLNTVKALLALRHAHQDLQADAPFEALSEGPGEPFVYRRGSLVLAVNPSGRAVKAAAPVRGMEAMYAIGTAEAEGETLTLSPQSFVVMGL